MKKVLEYLYSSNFDYEGLSNNCTKVDEDDEAMECHWAMLANCYIAADKYCLEDLQNKIMDFVKDAAKHNRIYASAVHHLSEAGLRSCPMRRFLLEEVAVGLCRVETENKDFDEEKRIGPEIHPESSKLLASSGCDAEDLLLTFSKCCKNWEYYEVPSTRTNKCDWHVHKKSEKCSRTEPYLVKGQLEELRSSSPT